MIKKITEYYKIYKGSTSDKKRLIEIVFASILILIIFLIKISCNGFWLWGGNLAFAETGQFGDFIGGVIGTIFSGAGFYFLYVTLVEQRKAIEGQKEAFERERFEAKFFDLIKLHRDNVSDQKYTKYEKNDMGKAEGRKVFRVIHREFEECLKEVKKFNRIYGNEFILNDQKRKLNKIKKENLLEIDIINLALIDLAYIIIFYGVARDSEAYLSNKFKGKYDAEYFKKLIKFLQLKPKKEYGDNFKSWNKFYALNVIDIKEKFDLIYESRSNKEYDFYFNHMNFFKNYKLEKYYGGHQHRLGHYFRHLFQSYKFLYYDKTLKEDEKYFYGKTLRAQLSTYEQSLLFVNSLSSLGLKWDLEPEVDITNVNKKVKLITKYNLIKNVPGAQLLEITYKDYYPNVDFEFEDN